MGNRYLTFLALFLVFTLPFRTLVSAEALPQFEGVYVRTVDGELLDLPFISNGKLEIKANPETWDIVEPEYILSFADAYQFAEAPIVDPYEAIGLVINSREDSITGIAYIVQAAPYVDPALTPRNKNVARAGKWGAELVVGRWGIWQPIQDARKRNIDAFNTEILFSAEWITDGCCATSLRRVDSNLPIFGFAVTTKKGRQYLLVTRKTLENSLKMLELEHNIFPRHIQEKIRGRLQ